MPPEQLILRAAAVFGVPIDALTGRSRRQHVVWARQATMLALRWRTDLSLQAIGLLFDGRDHSTVAAACAAAEERAATDAAYGARLDTLLAVGEAVAERPRPLNRRPDRWWIGLAEYAHRGVRLAA